MQRCIEAVNSVVYSGRPIEIGRKIPPCRENGHFCRQGRQNVRLYMVLAAASIAVYSCTFFKVDVLV